MKHEDAEKGLKERRSTSIMSKRISHILYDIILPMGQNIEKLPPKTTFTVTEYDILHDLFTDMLRECPTLARDPGAFWDALAALCHKHLGNPPATVPALLSGDAHA